MNATSLLPTTTKPMPLVVFPNRAPPLLPDPWRRQTETCDCSPENIAARATTITVVLENIFSQTGYPHGGINE